MFIQHLRGITGGHHDNGVGCLHSLASHIWEEVIANWYWTEEEQQAPIDDADNLEDSSEEENAEDKQLDLEKQTISDENIIRTLQQTMDRPTAMDLRSQTSKFRSGKTFSGQSGRELGLLNMNFLSQSLSTTDMFNNNMVDQNNAQDFETKAQEFANLVTS